jgi:hypothetical protein
MIAIRITIRNAPAIAETARVVREAKRLGPNTGYAVLVLRVGVTCRHPTIAIDAGSLIPYLVRLADGRACSGHRHFE